MKIVQEFEISKCFLWFTNESFQFTWTKKTSTIRKLFIAVWRSRFDDSFIYLRLSRSRCLNSLRMVKPSYFNVAKSSIDSALNIPKPVEPLRNVFAHSMLSWTRTHFTFGDSLSNWSHWASKPFVTQIFVSKTIWNQLIISTPRSFCD